MGLFVPLGSLDSSHSPLWVHCYTNQHWNFISLKTSIIWTKCLCLQRSNVWAHQTQIWRLMWYTLSWLFLAIKRGGLMFANLGPRRITSRLISFFVPIYYVNLGTWFVDLINTWHCFNSKMMFVLYSARLTNCLYAFFILVWLMF